MINQSPLLLKFHKPWGIADEDDVHLTLDDLDLKSQAPPVDAANIAADKIDVHADFCPWPEIIEHRGTGRENYDGSQTGVAYLHGDVVRKDFADQYRKSWWCSLRRNSMPRNASRRIPVAAAEQWRKWTRVEKEILYLYY